MGNAGLEGDTKLHVDGQTDIQMGATNSIISVLHQAMLLIMNLLSTPSVYYMTDRLLRL